MITTIEAILAATVYLLGGAFILFIYEAYTHTHHKNLLMLSIGMFIFIFSSNFDIFAGLVLSDYVEETMARTIALLIEIPGILVMLYSANKVLTIMGGDYHKPDRYSAFARNWKLVRITSRKKWQKSSI